MPIELPSLPYGAGDLEPFVSATTLEFHHGKHHHAYVDKVNELTAGTELQDASLEEIIRAARSAGDQKLLDQAGQAWNHKFFWPCMTRGGGGAPSGRLAELVDRDLGGTEGFRERFKTEGAGHFASGWAWLVVRGGKLEVISTHDADTALVTEGVFPVLVCDVWEHAYYLDHKQDRKGFLEAWFDRLANWSFAASQYEAATAGGDGWTYPRAG